MRSLRPDPPIGSAADAFVMFGVAAGWAVGLVGLATGIGVLTAVAGVVCVAAGAVLVLNVGGSKELYAERQRRRNLEGTVRYFPLLLFGSGVLWFAMGALQIASSS